MPKTLEEWKDLIVENLITDDDIDMIIENQRLRELIEQEINENYNGFAEIQLLQEILDKAITNTRKNNA